MFHPKDQHLVLKNNEDVPSYSQIKEAEASIYSFEAFYKAFDLFVYEVCDKLLSKMDDIKKLDTIKTLSPYFSFPFYSESHLVRLKHYNCIKGDLTGFFNLLEQEKDKLHQNDLKGIINTFYSEVMSKHNIDYLKHYLIPLNRSNKNSRAQVLLIVENKFKTTSTYGKEAGAYFSRFLTYSYMEFVKPFMETREILDAGVLVDKCDLMKFAFIKMNENIEKIIDDSFILKQITINN